MGNKLTASQRQNQSALPRIAVANPTAPHRQKPCSQVHKFSSRLKLPLSPDRGRSDPGRRDTSEAHGTALLRVRIRARADCMMRKRAQHEVLHIVLTILIGEEKVFSASSDIPSVVPKEQANEPKLLASPFTGFLQMSCI